jgi:hypothetical protein
LQTANVVSDELVLDSRPVERAADTLALHVQVDRRLRAGDRCDPAQDRSAALLFRQELPAVREDRVRAGGELVARVGRSEQRDRRVVPVASLLVDRDAAAERLAQPDERGLLEGCRPPSLREAVADLLEGGVGGVRRDQQRDRVAAGRPGAVAAEVVLGAKTTPRSAK